MATAISDAAPIKFRFDLAPTAYDRFLAIAAVVLLVAVAAAMVRGRDELIGLPVFLQAHIATIVVALALTPVMMLRRRGDRLHRRLGWLWATAMILTAAFSLGVRGMRDGGLSWIHILSAFTLIQVPRIVWAARRHDHAGHRSGVRFVVTGALLIAGAFTFPFGRQMGDWLFG